MAHGQMAGYRLLRKLKTGGMGEVYLACRRGPEGFEKLVALKKIVPQHAADPRFTFLFLQEARVAAELRHPNIVQIHDLGEAEDGYFLCMEFVDGPNLRDFLDAHRHRELPVPVGAAVWIAAKVFAALDYAHERATSGGMRLGVVHRDLSPPNILLSREGEVKLTDFGLAKVSPWSHETSTGALRGKFPYMSPEHVEGRHQDHRSDLYATGVVLFELLAGQPPFKDEGSPLKLLEEIRSRAAPDIRVMRSDVPPAVSDLLRSLLAKEPADRIQSARQAQLALERDSSYRGYSERRLARQIARVCPGPVAVASDEVSPGDRTPDASRPFSNRPATARRPQRADRVTLPPTPVAPSRAEAPHQGMPTRFVGRAEEMKFLVERFEKARTGSGSVVGIKGQAGVGKSRLVLELRRALASEGYTYLEGRCVPYGGAISYQPILEVVKALIGLEEGDPVEQVRLRVEEKVRDLDLEPASACPALFDLLSFDQRDERNLQVSPQERRRRIFEAGRNLLVAESLHRPLVVVLEDLQWIDQTSREFVDSFGEAVPGNRILFLLLYRPEFHSPWEGRPWFTEICVGQLSSRTSAALLQSVLRDGEVAEELSDLVLARAQGNPLFVEELAQGLIENGSVVKRGSRYVLARDATDRVLSDTIQGVISARMDRIEENLRRILQVASVIGKDLTYGILTKIMGIGEELKVCLLRLQGLGFVLEKRLAPELEYVFKHALTQDAAYDSLMKEGREGIHAEVAEAIETLCAGNLDEYWGLLAHHYASGGNLEKALKYLILANEKAIRTNALEEAKAHFDRAMEVLDRLPETLENRQRRISLLARQENVFLLLFRLAEYRQLLERFEPLAAAIEKPGLKGAYYARLGYCEFGFGQSDRSIEHAMAAADLCDQAGDPLESAYALYVAECSYVYMADTQHALSCKERVMARLSERFDLTVYVRARVLASWALSLAGCWNEAVKEGTDALAKATEYSDRSLISFASMALTVAFGMKGQMDKAIEFGELGVRTALTPADEVMTRSYLAWALSRSGQPAAGAELMDSLFRSLQAPGLLNYRMPVGAQLCDVLLAEADYDGAREAAEELLELAELCGWKWFAGRARRCLGEVALRTGSLKEAEDHLGQGLAILDSIGAENEAALARAALGRLRMKQRRWTHARRDLSEALATFERLGTLIEPDRVRQDLAALPA